MNSFPPCEALDGDGGGTLRGLQRANRLEGVKNDTQLVSLSS